MGEQLKEVSTAGIQDIHRIQRSFRSVMNASARPGKVFAMARPEEGSSQHFGVDISLAILVKMFIDQAVSFCVVSTEAPSIAKAIQSETHASLAPFESAAFLVIPQAKNGSLSDAAIESAYGGNLHSPETGASILLGCEYLASQEEEEEELGSEDTLYWVSVEGPGIQDSHVFGIDCLNWLWARQRRKDEFPCGIEIILVDRRGRVVVIPRTSFLSVLATEGEV